MKQYKVTVNGQSYDVSVEEVSAASARVATPVVLAAPAPAAAPAVSSTAPAAPQAVSAPVSGANSVKSPMPGTVLSFKVTVGQQVNKGDILLILEAMKMENEIVAPQAGKILGLRVAPGASVNTGDFLVDLG